MAATNSKFYCFNPCFSTITAPCSVLRSFPNIICFRKGDSPSPEDDRVLSIPPTLPELKYSPWAISMVKGLEKRAKHSSDGFDGGGAVGRGGGDGDSGGGRDDDDGDGGGDCSDGSVLIFPFLTVSLAILQLGYCVLVWVRDKRYDLRLLQIGIGLFCLLLLSAFRLKCRSGADAYILGLGASTGVTIWTGERCFVKKECTTAGFVAMLAALMCLGFSAALYDNI